MALCLLIAHGVYYANKLRWTPSLPVGDEHLPYLLVN